MTKNAFYISVMVVALIGYLQSCGSSSSTSQEEIPDKVSYNFDIRPILSDKCLACHGPDANKREAGLRLDDPESAFKALKDNPSAHAIIAGEPQRSEVFLRISTKDTNKLMPPPSSNLKLSAREIGLIEKWIKQGAKYEKHWAFVAPQKPAVPEVKNEDWPKNEIDFFVL